MKRDNDTTPEPIIIKVTMTLHTEIDGTIARAEVIDLLADDDSARYEAMSDRELAAAFEAELERDEGRLHPELAAHVASLLDDDAEVVGTNWAVSVPQETKD